MAADEYGWLDAEHPVFQAHFEAWGQDERRLYGGRAVLGELVQWKGEEEAHFRERQKQVAYFNLPNIHGSILTGHLRSNAPLPGTGAMSFGDMGEVRPRSSIAGGMTMAEQFWYECNGVGPNTESWEQWTDGVQLRAMATGVRWAMVQMPPRLPKMSVDEDGRVNVTKRDRWDGYRPFFVEFSPRRVQNWNITNGVLDFAVIRVPIGMPRVVDGAWTMPTQRLGYYLLVREGFEGLGTEFQEGGWWRFTADKERYLDEGQEGHHGSWRMTKGKIPLFAMVIGDSYGPEDFPTLGRPLTTELGAIAVALMHLDSARDFDAIDAAKSLKIIIGGDERHQNLLANMMNLGSLLATIPPYYPQDADGNLIPGAPPMNPTIYDASGGAVPAEVFTTIIQSKLALAKEIMVRQSTAGLEISGLSREAMFAEGTSPLLAMLAASREAFEQNMLYFGALSFDKDPETAFVNWPRRFMLAPLVDEIDRMILSLNNLNLRPPTLVKDMILSLASNRRLIDTDEKAIQIGKEVEQLLEGEEVERTQTRQMGDEISTILTGTAAAPAANGTPTPSGAALSGAGA